MTQISVLSVRSAVESSLSTSLRYVYDAILGGMDHNALFSQVSEASLFHLLLNPTSVYDLLLQGILSLGSTVDRISAALPMMVSAVGDLALQQRTPLRSLAAERAAANFETVLRYGRSERDVGAALRSLSKAVLAIPGLDEPTVESKTDVVELWSGVTEDLSAVSSTLQSLRSGVVSFQSLLIETTKKERLQQNQLLLAEELLPLLQSGELAAAKNHFLRMSAISVLFGAISTGQSIFQNSEAPVAVTVSPEDDGTLVTVEGIAGPYTMTYEDSVSINGVTEILRLSSRPWFAFPSDPTTSVDPRHVYGVVGYQDGWGTQPFRVEIPTLAWPHGRLSVLQDFSTALVGRTGSLRYVGDKTVLTPLVRAAVESNERRYMVVYADGSVLPNPEVELEPPITDTTTVPTTGWELLLDAHTVRWDYPAAFTKSAFITQLAGPASNSSVDVLQPWRVHHRLTGTASGSLRPGERIYVGTKEAVVIYHDVAMGHLYTHTPYGVFVASEILTGRTSSHTFSITSVDGVLGADIPSLAGQANTARVWTAHALTQGLYVQARETLGQGALATLVGTALTITLSLGERGFDELGIFPGDSIDLGGTLWVLDSVVTNTTATVVSGGSYAGAWSVPQPKRIDSLQTYTVGLSTQLSTDVSGNRVLRSYAVQSPTPEIPTLSGTSRREVSTSEIVSKLKMIFSGLTITPIATGIFSIASSSDIVFGSGTAHSILGLPSGETRKSTTKKIRLRQEPRFVSLGEVRGSPGDLLVMGVQSSRVVREEGGFVFLDTAVPRSSATPALLKNGRKAVWESSVPFLDEMLAQVSKIEESVEEISLSLESLLYAESELRGRIARELQVPLGVISAWVTLYQFLRNGVPAILSTTSRFLQMFDEEGLQGVKGQLLSGSFVAALEDAQFHQATSPGEMLDLLSEVASHLGTRIDPSILEEEESITVDVDVAYDDDAYDIEDVYPEDADP